MMGKVFFYPDFRRNGMIHDIKEGSKKWQPCEKRTKELGPKVMIFERTHDYPSGYVLIGCVGLITAIEIHGICLWLRPEQYKLTETNFNNIRKRRGQCPN